MFRIFVLYLLFCISIVMPILLAPTIIATVLVVRRARRRAAAAKVPDSFPLFAQACRRG